MYQLLCYIYPLIICGWDPPQVTTKWSRLEGIKEEFSGKRINTFLGIPYAEPPVGDLRFRPPVALSSTNFLQYYAGNYRSSCLDRHYHEKSKGSRFIDESEDCLFLNIWSPEDQQQSTSESSKTSPKLSSVLLYLNHISTDIRQINGKVLASLGDVTVVTFNYRTGLFGLIQNGDKDSLENAIYHDTKAVLDWIKENIQLFGGNPESITVIAEGWEAIKTGLALEGKYFDKLIITNGPLNSDEDDSHIDLDSVAAISKSVGCVVSSDTSSSSSSSSTYGEIIDCLRKVNAKTLFNQYIDFNTSLITSVGSSQSSSSIIGSSVWSNLESIEQSLEKPYKITGPLLSIQVNTEHDFEKILSSPGKLESLLSFGNEIRNSLESFGSPVNDIDHDKSIANSSSSNSLVIRDRHVAKWTLRHLSECPLFRLMENLSLGNNAIYSLLVDSTAHGFKSRPSLFRQVDLYSYRAFDILTGAPLLNTKLLHKEVQRLSRELIKIIGHFIRKGKAPWPKLSHSESGSVDIKKSYQYRISSEECSSNLDLAMKSQFCSILQKL